MIKNSSDYFEKINRQSPKAMSSFKFLGKHCHEGIFVFTIVVKKKRPI